MIIESLRLENFRNYESLELDFSPATNLFYGDNAQGKTNILEALYFCGTSRSHRSSKDKELIRFGEQEAHLRMEFSKKGQPFRIDMHLKSGRAKGIAVNSVPIKRARELLGLGNYIFFSPEDLSIIKNGPSERRRFMDMELCQLSSVFLSSLGSYNKVLLQRNALLKDLRSNPSDMATLDVWDEQLVSYGRDVIEARDKFVKRLDEIIRPIHRKISGGREELCVSYEADTDSESFAAELKKNRERDIYLKTSHTGPHRDDMSFKILMNGKNDDWIDIRRYGSQGQQRSAALSLKMAEIELVKEKTGDTPVLLLDDVLSELDLSRQNYLLSSIKDIQTFISCTGQEGFEKNGFQIDKLFNVKDGRVIYS